MGHRPEWRTSARVSRRWPRATPLAQSTTASAPCTASLPSTLVPVGADRSRCSWRVRWTGGAQVGAALGPEGTERGPMCWGPVPESPEHTVSVLVAAISPRSNAKVRRTTSTSRTPSRRCAWTCTPSCLPRTGTPSTRRRARLAGNRRNPLGSLPTPLIVAVTGDFHDPAPRVTRRRRCRGWRPPGRRPGSPRSAPVHDAGTPARRAPAGRPA
ncbi:hypothetical protein KIPE111705_11975 [Kibdelosporangium persicum]